jgi:hypothetical protein
MTARAAIAVPSRVHRTSGRCGLLTSSSPSAAGASSPGEHLFSLEVWNRRDGSSPRAHKLPLDGSLEKAASSDAARIAQPVRSPQSEGSEGLPPER